MIRHTIPATVGFLTMLAFGPGPSVAAARSDDLRLHVEGYSGSGASVLNLALPWDSNEKKSPFDFTENECEALSIERMRWAWSALRDQPEGRTVTIETHSGSILASKRGGYLVLVPHQRDRDDHHSRVAIPDYIVNAVLEHDGRLSNQDVGRLVRERGKITLVKMNSDVGSMKVWLDRSEEDPD